MSDHPSNRSPSKARFFKSSRSPGKPSSSRRPFDGKKRLYNTVSVRFESSFVRHEYNAQLLDVHDGEKVIVETSKGPAMATVVSYVQRKVAPTGSLKRVLRIATREDIRKSMRNRARQDEAFRFALESIRARKLPMKLVQVQIMHDMSKAIFYFSAEGRVDFRELVRDLAGFLKTRIEMRQIGVRDGARMIGGIGSCGRELCCSTFLEQFAPVSIRMAKDQGLTLNPRRVSGVCGRLMCCLVYEQHVYRRTRRRLPRAGRSVHTEFGYGVVQSVDVVQELVSVAFEDGKVEHLSVRSVVLLDARNAPKNVPAASSQGEKPPAERLREALEEGDTQGGEEYLWEAAPEGDRAPREDRGERSRRSSSRGRRGGRKRSSASEDQDRSRKGRSSRSSRSSSDARSSKPKSGAPRSEREESRSEGGRGGQGRGRPSGRRSEEGGRAKQDPARRRRKRGGRRGKPKPSSDS